MAYSWHEEYYQKALREITATAGRKCEHSLYDCHGWLEWFEKNHSELYKKFENALLKIHQLWGDMKPEVMENFKSAIKVEVDATKWAVDQYLEFQEKQAEEEKIKGTQEALV